MMTTATPRYSKSGWPISKYEHLLGSFVGMESTVRELCRLIERKYDVTIKLERPVADDEPNYWRLTTRPCKLSMEKYGLIRAFIDGFRAANY